MQSFEPRIVEVSFKDATLLNNKVVAAPETNMKAEAAQPTDTAVAAMWALFHSSTVSPVSHLESRRDYPLAPSEVQAANSSQSDAAEVGLPSW